MKRLPLLALVLFTLGLAERSSAQPGQIYSYTISTVVGAYQLGTGPANKALLAFPEKMFIDSQGAVYIADNSNHMVRKIVGGQISTIAGTGISGFSGDGQAATKAQLANPCGVAADKTGNVYIYDCLNTVVRKVDTNGIITTFAGIPHTAGSAGDGGPATKAMLRPSLSNGLAVDPSGNLYISDFGNNVIRKVTASTNIITTVAGITGKPGAGGDGGLATSANLSYPGGLSFDAAGNLYIADTYNQSIRMVSATSGTISTVAGGHIGAGGDGGPPKSASLQYPTDVAVDASGNIYIADSNNNKIRKVTVGANPIINTLAGNGTAGFSGDGGPATSAEISFPSGVAVDGAGTVYIVDDGNSRIRTVSGGNIAEFAGSDHAQGDGGKASAALLFFPQRFAWDSKGNMYIADGNNNRIRKVTPDGIISTIAGNGTFANTGDGGPAIAAEVIRPLGIASDSAGNIYFSAGPQVRKIDTQGNISTIVNTGGTPGFSGDGQEATAAKLNGPQGLALDSAGNLYIADEFNHRVRKVSVGIISTVAGTGPICGNPCQSGTFGGDGGPATAAHLNFPTDVAFDNSGNLLIADTANSVVRMVDANGNINTLAGIGAKPGYGGDVGPAASALLNNPWGIAIDNAGNLYIVDTANEVVRVVDALGIISTIAGNTTVGFSGDGGPAISAELNGPHGVAVDPSGRVWFVDVSNHRIRQLTPSGPLVPGSAAVVNAASFVPGGVVPGGMATMFGSNLTSGKGINLASGLPLATQLLNSSVKFNNTVAAPIFAVDNVNGQEQINFQVPWELSPLIGSSVVLQVSNNGQLGIPVRVPVLAAQPGVFAYNVGSDTFGVVLHANFQLADSGHPATGGEVVLIYCTNLGAVSPAIKDGEPGTGSELTVAKPSVTVGGAPATVSFSGLAPGFVGLYQINVEIPKGLVAKNQPVVVNVSGASSKPVLLPVK